MNNVSVIIPTYNSAGYIERCLRSIRELELRHKLKLEIIVVDATSEDETVNIASEYATQVVTTVKSTIGRDRNLGAAVAKNETLAFIDSDCEVTESWINFVSEMDCLSLEMLTGPVLLAKSNTIIGESARDLLSDSILTLNSYTFSGMKTKRTIVNEAPSSNMLISKEVFRKVGGFPELSFNEDTLFCTRFRALGGKIINEPRLICFHHRHFDDFGYFSKYFFVYGENYAKAFREFGLARRYAFVSFAFVSLLVISAMAVFWRFIAPTSFLVIFAIFFLTLLLYSIARNKKLSSVLIPFLFILLILSYVGGFYFGLVKT